MALLALEAKQYDTAGEFFELALAAKPKQAAEVFMVWGVGLLDRRSRRPRPPRCFSGRSTRRPLPADNPTFHFYLAGALALAERTDEALAAARTAAEKKKDSARFRGRPAWVLYFAKRYDEAMKAYRELIDKFDADHASAETRDVLREARLALSNLAVIKGDLPQAEEWLEQVLDEFPDDAGAMNDLGYLWADAEQAPRAGRADDPAGRRRRARQRGLPRQPGLGAVPPGQVPARPWPSWKRPPPTRSPTARSSTTSATPIRRLDRRDKAVEAWRKAAEVFRQEKETEKAKAVEKKDHCKLKNCKFAIICNLSILQFSICNLES